MALVSREVASYPMQGAVERPPAPTLSPGIPNPLLSRLLPSSSGPCPSSPKYHSLRLSRWGSAPSVFFPFSSSTSSSSSCSDSSSYFPFFLLFYRTRRITGIPPSEPKVVPSSRGSLSSGTPRYILHLLPAVLARHTQSSSRDLRSDWGSRCRNAIEKIAREIGPGAGFRRGTYLELRGILVRRSVRCFIGYVV